MPVKIEPNAEPIPGYRLIERLGGGGFGEVWKAEAPGGLFKAIKFVYGDLQALDDEDGSRAEQELKALSRVKTVHHPYILSLERYDIIDGQLLIVMELADRTLWDRFRECRNQGLPGIPRAELLRYMRETAEALDLMNGQFALQHLDVKPQNLFLVFNHVKVADFGLVKDLGTKAAATVTGGVTPVYAAPETFDGWLSRFSDQYSLAIVYQELLTGQRPFSGGTMRQLVLQHIQGHPDLTPLPVADRPAVARALSKNPEERFPTCLEFVEQFLHGGVAPAPANPVILTPDTSTAPRTPPPPAPMPEEEFTRDARGKISGPPRSSDPPPTDQDIAFQDRPNILPPRPGRLSTPTLNLDDEIASTINSVAARTSPFATPLKPPVIDRSERGVLQPGLVIGLGKLGIDTLREFRTRLVREVGPPELYPALRLLAIDTDPETLAAGGDPRAALKPSETLLTRLQRPSHYVKSKRATDNWLNPKLIYRIPRDQNCAGLRALGRLAFVDNFRLISKRLEAELRLCSRAEEEPSEGELPLSLRSRVPRIYVVSGLTGNTGSGMFLDVAYLIRHLLKQQGLGTAEVIGLFYLPVVGQNPALRAAALANSYAALTELNHFVRGESAFAARYPVGDDGRVDITETGSAFQRCILLELPEASGALSSPDNRPATALAGDFLYRDMATVLGRNLDERRQEKLNAVFSHARRRGEIPCQSLGLFRLAWPRTELLDGCARRLCRRLVDRWMNKDGRPLADTIRQWASEKWDSLQLRPEDLIAQMHDWCERELGVPTDRVFSDLAVKLLPPPPTPGSDRPPMLGMAALLAQLQELEQLIGVPEECRSPQQQSADAGRLERVLVEGAAQLGDTMEQKLAELAVQLIEDPRYRLAGAEEVLRQFSAAVERALQSQEGLVKELSGRAIGLYQRLFQIPDAPPTITPTASLWKGPFGRRPNPAASQPDASQPFRAYAKARYHSLVLAQIQRLYVALRGQLSDQLREVGFCRQRLSELSGIIQTPEGAESIPAAPHAHMLLPAACSKLSDAIERTDRSVTSDDLQAFDQRAQDHIKQHHSALVQVCMGSSSTVRALAPQLVREAVRFLEPKLSEVSVAEMFFAHVKTTKADMSAELKKDYDRALPRFGSPAADLELAVVGVPEGPAGKELQQELRQRLPHVHLIRGGDEILFYREHLHVPLGELAQVGPAAQEAYRQRSQADPASLHCREDISTWQPLAVTGS